ncbi:metallophosphoesterase family protein [Roseobacter weihaiensis]|uniref:metallophosphoesterase family protein n=1 Tax=Roseobacter weihaiensis TaxID=2763262 RepID=UPI001D0A5354|nr:metallophosphoesterase family protein [Roseobacter sp. H9]
MPDPIYAIGDIHGQLEELHRVLELIEKEGGPEAKVVFVGDYVDRGLNSKAVVQTLIDGQARGRNWMCLKGNHDRYLTRFVDDMIIQDPCTATGLFWLHPRLGGDKTLLSYGVLAEDGWPIPPIHAEARQAVPEAHLDFLRNLPLIHETDDLIFVHAGLRPGVPLAQQEEDDLVWIRDPFLTHKGSFGKLVVHGHTALEHPQHAGNRVNLDGGAGYFRPLNAAVFEGRDCWLLSDAGRVPLIP